MEIKFNDKAECQSQQTLVGILKKHKFYFKPINEYENSMFYLVIRYSERKKTAGFFNKLFGWAHKLNEERYIEKKISYVVLDDEGFETLVPCVYTRKDIIGIISDTHENYVGEDIL